MSVVTLELTKNSDLVQQALYFITHSHSIGIAPQMIMSCAAEDRECEHPVCFVYGGEQWMTTERGMVAPMTPFVTAWQVGAWLIQHGWAVNEHETMRFGVRVKWFDLAVHVLE